MKTKTLSSDQQSPTSIRSTKEGPMAIKERLRDFLIHVLGQVRILKRIYPGIMHALIFWGMTFIVLGHVINLLQMELFVPFIELPFPRGNTYLVFELLGDLAGLALLIGLLMAAFRRAIIRPKYLVSRWDDYLVIILAALIPILGYLNEGVRIIATAPTWANWSPVGNMVANSLRRLGLSVEIAASLHTSIIWTHLIIGLILIASIPFTKLRHLVFIPINIILRPLRKEGVLSSIEDIENAELLGVNLIEEFSTQQLMSFDACVQCGRCEDICPIANSGAGFSPRAFIHSLRESMQGTLISPIGNNNPHRQRNGIFTNGTWSCTSCGACASVCPAFVNPLDEIIDLRRYQVLTSGKIPSTVRETLRNLERQGNPWGIPPQERENWAECLNARKIKAGDRTDVLLFLGCSLSFDERNKKIARATVRLLETNNVDFGYLGLDENCCGETARRLGHEYLFQMMAIQNIEILSNLDFNRIVTQCPHCFNTLKNEYPYFGGNYEVLHVTQFFRELNIAPHIISETRNEFKIRVTYHDPCYLGRYNDIFSAPRKLLDSSTLTRVEMKHNKASSFCCGGGGGQMWLETDAETRINNRRLEDALSVQTDIVATACPYCLTMFEDAISSKGLGGQIQVKDISEILIDQMETETGD